MSPRPQRIFPLETKAQLSYSFCPTCGVKLHSFYCPEDDDTREWFTCFKHIAYVDHHSGFPEDSRPLMGTLTQVYSRDVPKDVAHAFRMYWKDL